MKRLIILSLFMLVVLSASVRADVTTDKPIYRPGETISIVLDYSEPLTDVKFSLIDPNGNTEISGTPMENTSSSSWGYNYTLSTRALNGTYAINVTALQGGTVVNASIPVLTFNDNFDVVAWNMEAYPNNYYFIPGEAVNLTVLVTDKYSDTLTFNAFYNISDSQGNEVEAKNVTLTQVNNGFTDVYEIPLNYYLGTSIVNIVLVDSDGRTSSESLGFSVSKSFAITPDVINETVNNAVEETFDIENLRGSDINIRDIEVSDNLKNSISIVQRPYLILANENATMKIRMIAGNLTEGSHSGVINISTDEEAIPIFVNLMIAPSSVPESNTPENLPGNIDYSYVIWYFAAGIVVVIAVLTVLRYRKVIKKKKEERKRQEENKKKEDNFFKSREEYRTEYY